MSNNAMNVAGLSLLRPVVRLLLRSSPGTAFLFKPWIIIIIIKVIWFMLQTIGMLGAWLAINIFDSEKICKKIIL
jgi:hypothetical protein